ncbi:MAG: hypothetical protein U0167_08030 [bacterium]
MRAPEANTPRLAGPLGRVAIAMLALVAALAPLRARADVPTPVPQDQRGRLDAERSGFHDASNIRTVFWNYGMVGDYPPDPGNVDLSVFHSVEVPKGSGMNYSDGITPFVLAKITQANGVQSYIMETGFRERQATSPNRNVDMRFEPRPGYFEPSPILNPARSPAISNDPRTWPSFWPDKLYDPDDPGWRHSWNGYFGKQIVADQESFMVMDDDFYDAWYFFPDRRDSTRKGLGLRVEVRGFQWANPQARNVIFWHYDITNESTTDYDDNIVFGLYMDSGVGGSALSCDGIYESDDDNAFFDRTFDQHVINLVYTWDRFGHGRDLTGNCGSTGYLGYAYLETPGNSTDRIDNDEDGITDEKRDADPGEHIVGQPAILSYVNSHYDLVKFENTYGPVTETPAYRAGDWWTGDEDMDWVAELHDTGVDGVMGTHDTGEGDGMPTQGEPNFGQTDLNESDQIGLTGFKINRIRPGQGNPDQTTDGIVFFTDAQNWPERLFQQFTSPDSSVRFGPGVASNYNIAFLFASGPFTLKQAQHERFSLALAYGADLNELRGTVRTVQQIYDANYRFAVPPQRPTATAEAGDGFVRLSWDDIAERSADPVTGELDFEGYRIYRSTDPEFRDPQVISTGTGSGPIGNGKPIAQFDLKDGKSGFSEQVVEGVAYFLGTDSGIQHTWTDYGVTNGQLYYYAVTAYDFGSTRLGFYPSENSITVSRTPRGGTVLPSDVVAVRPDPRVAGYVPATVSAATHVAGEGTGDVAVEIVNSGIVPNRHRFGVAFSAPSPDSIRATAYALIDSTSGDVFFETGHDLDGKGIGPVGAGLLPVVYTQSAVQVDTARTGLAPGSPTDARLRASYLDVYSVNRRRPGFPDDITIRFYDTVVDTSLDMFPFTPTPIKFRAIAHTASGDLPLKCRFRDRGTLSGTLADSLDVLDVVTYAAVTDSAATWRVQLDPATAHPTRPPAGGDVFELHLTRPLGAADRFVFDSHGDTIDPNKAKNDFSPYVVPNPYVGSASFEPERFAVSGRGERRIEFRGLPAQCTIRIYTVRGDLVQTLHQNGTREGFVAWNLRTKDNLDVAPGLYIFHVQVEGAGSAGLGEKIGKFAVIK